MKNVMERWNTLRTECGRLFFKDTEGVSYCFVHHCDLHLHAAPFPGYAPKT